MFKELNTEAQWNALLQIEINKKCVQSISVPLLSGYLVKINTARQSMPIPLECHNMFRFTRCCHYKTAVSRHLTRKSPRNEGHFLY
jgi:hypothetical protein